MNDKLCYAPGRAWPHPPHNWLEAEPVEPVHRLFERPDRSDPMPTSRIVVVTRRCSGAPEVTE